MSYPESSGLGKKLRTALVIVCILGALGAVYSAKGLLADKDLDGDFVLYTVAKGDLPIVVTERGNLDSQNETLIRCKVESRSDRSGNNGAAIIFIVSNGSAVKEGDLLCELDSASIRDSLEQQELAYQRAISGKTQAIAKYKNQLLTNKTALAEAELAVELAKLELKMFEDPKDGTLQLDVETIDREIDKQNNSILESRSKLKLDEINQSGVEELFKLGYRNKRELDESRLTFLQSEGAFTSAINQLKTLQGNRRKLQRYESKMDKLKLSGAVETALRAKDQVINDNVSLEEQALAAKLEAEKTEEKEKERLDRLASQLEFCTIYAPHDGMVVYARERRGGTEIKEGAVVRERQGILTLPNLSHMQVKTQVHEAVLDQVTPGLKATVRVDAFPDKVYTATVKSVAVVPSDSWFSTKTYETIITIDGEVQSLKPGMNAVAEIHVERIRDVVTIPVQAITQIGGDNWVYLSTGDNKLERRPIELGRSNDKFVHIREGLEAGERVVLNPMDIVSDRENQISPDGDQPEVSDESEEPPAKSLVKTGEKKKQAATKQGKNSGRGANGRASGASGE